jgi:hypothetical protein
VGHRLAGGVLGDLLGGVGRALAGAFEADAPGAGPADDVALHVGDADLVLLNVARMLAMPLDDVLGALGLDDLLAGHLVRQQLGGGGRGASAPAFGGFRLRRQLRRQLLRQPSARRAPAGRFLPSPLWALLEAGLALAPRRRFSGFSAPFGLASFFGERRFFFGFVSHR